MLRLVVGDDGLVDGVDGLVVCVLVLVLGEVVVVVEVLTVAVVRVGPFDLKEEKFNTFIGGVSFHGKYERERFQR